MSLTYQQRVLAIPAYIRLPLLLLSLSPGLALGIYWWYAYAGPYRWLIEGQTNLFGHYLPVYTGIFTVAIGAFLGFGPAALVVHLLVKLNVFPVHPDNPPPVPGNGTAVERWEQEHRGRLIGLIVGVMGVIAGAVLTVLGMTAGSLQPLNLAALEAGQPPPSNYVQVRGRLLTDRMLSQRVGTALTYYVPLVSDRWQNGVPVTLYVAVPDTLKAQAERGPLEGMLSENGLPGPLCTAFQNSGAAQPAQPHYLLQMGRQPQTYTEFGLGLLGIGIVALAATGAVWLFKALRGPNVRPGPISR